MLGSSFRTYIRLCILLTSAAVLLLSGCGFGGADQSLAVSNTVFRGNVHGGPNPVVGATVTLYSTLTLPGPATVASTYGSPGIALATAVTGPDGSFMFTSRLPCPAVGEQAYVTASGGNPGGPPGTTNPNYVLFAALGNCSDITTDTFIWVDELSTVASAYALSGFTTTTTLAGNITVNVGAPVNAAAASGSCTNTVATTGGVTTTTATSCVTAGLRHAFQNAANLVNVVGTFEAPPNGQAYTSAPSSVGSEVPQALINSLANALQSCVNSTGGAAGDSNPCGRLFHDTTPPGGAAPTNTVDAMIDLAKNPTLNTADIYALATPQIFYSPSLLAAPNDFSLAIVYPRGSVGFPAGQPNGAFGEMALDSNDTVYGLFQIFPSSGNPGFITADSLTAVASNGSLIFPATYSANSHTGIISGMATDTLGNIWLAFFGQVDEGGHPASDAGEILRYSATTGGFVQGYAPAQGPATAIAVDRQNNVWYGFTSNNINEPVLFDLVQSNSYSPAVFLDIGITTVYGLAIDANQNIWGVESYPAFVFPNTGMAAAPAYANPLIVKGSASSPNPNSGIAMDAAGNGWSSNFAGEHELVPTLSDGIVTAISSSSVDVGQAKLYAIEVDGAGSVWSISNAAIVKYIPSASTHYNLFPCRVVVSTSLCGTAADSPPDAAFNGPRWLQVDSTGSMWIADGAGTLAQVIGSAAPTWPQLSYGHPGVTPQ